MEDHELRFDLSRLDRFLVRGIWSRMGVTAAVVLAAGLAKWVAGAETVARTPVLGLVWMAVLGWVWGPIGGVLSGALLIPVGNLVASGLHTAEVVPPAGILPASMALVMVGGVVGSLRLVVERLGVELEARREAETEVRTIHDRLPIGVFRMTLDGEILEANRAFGEMVGRRPAELAGTRLGALSGRDGEEHLPRLLDPDAQGVVVPLTRPDGSMAHGRFHCRLVRDEQGRPWSVEGAVRDVTELLASEEEARRAAELFRNAFDNAPIGIVLSDPEGRILRVNAAFARLIGTEPEDLVGLPWLDLTHPEDRARSAERFADARERGEDLYEIEKRYVRRDGGVLWALVRTSAVRRPDGSLQYSIGQVVDITARRLAAEALEDLVRAKDEFVASVSHELRTPLTVVLGLAQELRDSIDGFDRDEIIDLVALIAEQSREVASIVEDLLVAARADIGKVSVVPTGVDVGGQVQEVVAGIPGTSEADLSAVEQVEVLADPVRLRQILRNLVTNALRYGGSGVRVRTREMGDRVLVEVADDGPGIPPDQWESVFEPYERAHHVQGQTASVGLGLTVSRKLARLMGGDLTYRYDEGWSTFCLALPAGGRAGDRYHPVPAAVEA